jgi:hypothetical protein
MGCTRSAPSSGAASSKGPATLKMPRRRRRSEIVSLGFVSEKALRAALRRRFGRSAALLLSPPTSHQRGSVLAGSAAPRLYMMRAERWPTIALN